jgi:hypothetical protein
MRRCPACTESLGASATKCPACGAPVLEPTYGLLESRLTAEQEAALPVPRWLPVLFGLLGIGGASWGLLALAMTVGKLKLSLGTLCVLALAAALFLFAGYCGVRALQRAPGWLRLNQVLWSFQVPLLVSPAVSYAFASGGFFTIWLQLHPQVKLGWNGFLGSSYSINLFTPGPVILGVNLLAVALAYYLARLQRAA